MFICIFFTAANGKYWAVGEDGAIVADGSAKTQFWLQFRGNSMLTILADNGCFIKGEQNGLFRAVGREIDQTVLWEF